MLLHAVQAHFGYLSRQAVEWIALGAPHARAFEGEAALVGLESPQPVSGARSRRRYQRKRMGSLPESARVRARVGGVAAPRAVARRARGGFERIPPGTIVHVGRKGMQSPCGRKARRPLNPPGGRRIGMDRVVFDKEGNMSVTVTDTPQWGPGAVTDPAKGDSGSIPVTINKIRAMNALSRFSSQQAGRDAQHEQDNRGACQALVGQ